MNYEDDSYREVLQKIETHSRRTVVITEYLKKTMDDTTQVLRWVEEVMRLNGLESNADNVHKVQENLIDSYGDIGEMIGLLGGDIHSLVEEHVKTLTDFIKDMDKIEKEIKK